MTSTPRPARPARVRMTSEQRREQLLQTARELFAERGFEGTAVEEIAARAGVSKPVVYEHFGGKEGAYAVVVDRETRKVRDAIRTALTSPNAGPRKLLELAAVAMLDYVDNNPEGFRILVRDSSSSTGSFASILSDIGVQVEDILADEFESRGRNPEFAMLYSQALVGLVSMTAQQWLEQDRHPDRLTVARHLINLAWYGMAGLKENPRLVLEDDPDFHLNADDERSMPATAPTSQQPSPRAPDPDDARQPTAEETSLEPSESPTQPS